MKSYEQQAFEATASVHDIPGNYQGALNAVVFQVNDVLGGLGSWETNFQFSGMDLADFLARRSELIGDTLSDTAKKIGGIIGAAPEVIDGLPDFSAQDRSHYHQALSDFKTSPHMAIYNLNKNNPFVWSQNIIRVALDDIVYSEARDTFKISPASSDYQIDRSVSSPQVGRAMKVGLDDLVYSQGYEDAKTSPVSGKYFFQRHASSKRASQAMTTGLDSLVYGSARRIIGISPISANHQVKNQASSPKAANIIIDDMAVPRQKAAGSDWSERVRQATNTPPPRPPRQEAAPKPKPQKTPYQLFMTDLRSKDRDTFETIRAFDEVDVARVIATVKHLREKDPTITDKQIAIKYARASNNAEEASPERKRATQIVMALMGNKVSGQLPF
ncbi:MAG: hypothetical protein ABIQ89_03715 [Candidatus Saccharimonadales bacterium]